MLVRNDNNVVAMFDVKVDQNAAVASQECQEAIEELKIIKRQIKLLKESAAAMRKVIESEIGNKDKIVGNEGTVIATYKFQEGRAEIDRSLLEEFYPEAYKDCIVKGKGYRTLLLK